VSNPAKARPGGGGGQTLREQAITMPITSRNYNNTKNKNNNRNKKRI
jgi:hypothetical protein